MKGITIMKKTLLLIITVAFMISVTACGKKEESDSNDKSQISSVTEDNEKTNVKDEEDIAGSEGIPGTNIDYSIAKNQIDSFNESISGYTADSILDDRGARWIVFYSNNDYYSGGQYGGNWKIYVVNDETKQFGTAGLFNDTYTKEGDKHEYDYLLRIGNGTYRVCAIYQNDEKNVYFYAEDEVVIDDSVLTEYKGLNSVIFNVTELVGADFTSMTYQLDNN